MSVRTASRLLLVLLLAGPARAGAQPVHAEPAPDAAAAPAGALEDALLVLAVRLDHETLSDGVEAYQLHGAGGGALLPLGQLAALLGLAVQVDAAHGRAHGWVLREDRRFELVLDAARGTARATCGEVQLELAAGRVLAHAGELYVDAGALSTLWPVDLGVDAHGSLVQVRPREKLPRQKQREREREVERSLARLRGDAHAEYPELELPSAVFRLPSVDQAVGVRAQPGTPDAAPQVDWSTLATGQLLWLDAQARARGTLSGRPELRGHVGRKDPEGGLLGPLGATEVGAGDLYVPGVDLLTLPQAGVGVTLSSRPLERPLHFDRHSFRGELQPGWEVELLHNGALVGYQQAREDGRFEFLEMPMLFGINDFELVFHGPQGQERRERQRYYVGAQATPRGEAYYRLTAAAPYTGGKRALLEADVGLTRFLSSSLALTAVEQDGAAVGSGKLSVHGFWRWLSTGVHVAGQLGGGVGAQAYARAHVRGLSLSAEHARLAGLRSEWVSRSGSPLATRTTLALDATLPLPGSLPQLPLRLEARRDQRTDGGREEWLLARTSLRVRRLGLTHELYWGRALGLGAGVGAAATERGGRALVSTQLGPAGLRGELSYSLLRGGPAPALSLVAESRSRSGYHVSAGVTRSAGKLGLQAGVGKSEGRFGLSVQGGWSPVSGASVNARLSFALGRDERRGGWRLQARSAAGTGAASARVFLDANNDGEMGPDERPLPDVEVTGAGGRRVRTDAHGLAVLPDLPAHHSTSIGLVAASLEDPYWRATREGVRLVPRPGQMALVDFPVQVTGEVTGTLYGLRRGRRVALPGVEVELVAQDGEVYGGRTGFDGYYDILEVPPGEYTLRVPTERLALLKLALPTTPRRVHIGPDGTVLDGVDVVLAEASGVPSGPRKGLDALSSGQAQIPKDPRKAFEVPGPNGLMKVHMVEMTRFPLAAWAAGLPLSPEETARLTRLAESASQAPRSLVLIVAHAQTTGARSGAVKRAGRGAEALKRYLQAVQLIPGKRILITVVPPPPVGGEPLGVIELALVEAPKEK